MIVRYISGFLCLVFSIFFINCGKHEAAGGTVGAASGALVGNIVSGGRSKGVGTLVGALVGNVLGRAVGQAADEEERHEEERHTRMVRAAEKAEMHHLKEENRVLKKQLRTWCYVCSRKVTIIGAHRCPDCGHACIKEKYCGCCGVIFSPDIRYRFCPYCTDRVVLSVR